MLKVCQLRETLVSCSQRGVQSQDADKDMGHGITDRLEWVAGFSGKVGFSRRASLRQFVSAELLQLISFGHARFVDQCSYSSYIRSFAHKPGRAPARSSWLVEIRPQTPPLRL